MLRRLLLPLWHALLRDHLLFRLRGEGAASISPVRGLASSGRDRAAWRHHARCLCARLFLASVVRVACDRTAGTHIVMLTRIEERCWGMRVSRRSGLTCMWVVAASLWHHGLDAAKNMTADAHRTVPPPLTHPIEWEASTGEVGMANLLCLCSATRKRSCPFQATGCTVVAAVWTLSEASVRRRRCRRCRRCAANREPPPASPLARNWCLEIFRDISDCSDRMRAVTSLASFGEARLLCF